MTYRLEDMLNDCAVIRTTFETLDLFPANDPIRGEIQQVINDARANMRRHCIALCADIDNLAVLDRLLNLEEFSKVVRKLLLTGYPRRHLDAFMKVNAFQSVAETEAGTNSPDALYRYELLPPVTVPTAVAMSAKSLTTTIFSDLLQSVKADANYANKHDFDRNVYQKYVAIMLACYVPSDPFFYN